MRSFSPQCGAALACLAVVFAAAGVAQATDEAGAASPAPPTSFRGAWRRGDVERGHSPGVAADGIFWIGSLSKTFAAAATLRLVERGALALDAPVDGLLPGLDRLERDGEACTVARLLRHTCGLPEELPERACLWGHLDDPERRDCFVAAVNRAGASTPPGAQFRYSNVGYDLLGLILSEVSGLHYEELLRRELWAPLEMHDTGISLPPARAQRLVRGEMVLFGLALDAATWNMLPVAAPARFGASGNIHSSVDDLIRWTEGLHGGAVLSADSYARMISPGAGDYGDGLIISERPFGRVLWHSGSLSPFSYNGFVGWSVAREEAVVVLSARAPAISHSGRVAEALWLGEPAPEPTLLDHLRAALSPAGLLLGVPVLALSCARRSLRARAYPRLEWLVAHHTLLIAVQFLVARFREPAETWLACGVVALFGLLGAWLALPALARASWLGARPLRQQAPSLALSAALCVALLVIAPIQLAWTQAALLTAEALLLTGRIARLRRRERADVAPS